jgi:hypothetical protein
LAAATTKPIDKAAAETASKAFLSRWETAVRQRVLRLGAGGELGLAWLVAFLSWVLVQHQYAWIPAYHDGVVHWDIAEKFHRDFGLPFVREFDTGHPPLVSFALALLWLFPVGKVLAMHVLTWSVAALLVAAVFVIGRRLGHWSVGLCAAALTALHPVVAAQALQLNLDLFVAAFAWFAVLGAVCARPGWVATGCTLASLAKLNGGFVVLPFALWLLLRQREGWYRPIERALASLWPLIFPAVAFATYHLGKRLVTGRWLASQEFQDANLDLVSSLREYEWHLRHSVLQYLNYNNGNGAALLTAILAIAVLGALHGKRALSALTLVREPKAGATRHQRAFSGEPTVYGGFVLMTLLAVTQILLWSLRHYPSLVRYFVTAYPTLYLIATLSASYCTRRYRTVAVIAVTAPIALGFFFRTHPNNGEAVAEWRLPVVSAVARGAIFPPRGVRTNHETNLELADQLAVTRQLARELPSTLSHESSLAVAWPFDAYFDNPAHGFVDTPWNVVNPAAGAADAVLVFSTGEFSSPEAAARNWPDHRMESVQERGRVWAALLVSANRD